MFTLSLFILLFSVILKFGISSVANPTDGKAISEIGADIDIQTVENSIKVQKDQEKELINNISMLAGDIVTRRADCKYFRQQYLEFKGKKEFIEEREKIVNNRILNNLNFDCRNPRSKLAEFEAKNLNVDPPQSPVPFENVTQAIQEFKWREQVIDHLEEEFLMARRESLKLDQTAEYFEKGSKGNQKKKNY
jgi:hypothetical protein